MSRIEVVLVENDAAVMGSLKDYIVRNENMDLVGSAYDGRDAWDKITTLEPDVVIMELLMPYMDGFEILNKIMYGNDLEKKPKIIITSTMSNDAIVKESFKLGVSYFMIKPYDPSSITSRIMQLFENEYDTETNGIILNMDAMVSKELIHMGTPVRLKGYRYMVTAVSMVAKDESLIYGVTKILYPLIAKKYKTTPTRVEKAIRHAIEVTWSKGDSDSIRKIFDDERDKKRPTNSQFIALMAQKMRESA